MSEGSVFEVMQFPFTRVNYFGPANGSLHQVSEPCPCNFGANRCGSRRRTLADLVPHQDHQVPLLESGWIPDRSGIRPVTQHRDIPCAFLPVLAATADHVRRGRSDPLDSPHWLPSCQAHDPNRRTRGYRSR
jgi:hypothetical protein